MADNSSQGLWGSIVNKLPGLLDKAGEAYIEKEFGNSNEGKLADTGTASPTKAQPNAVAQLAQNPAVLIGGGLAAVAILIALVKK